MTDQMMTAADAIREVLARNPDVTNSELIAMLPQYNDSTLRTLLARYRSTGSMSGSASTRSTPKQQQGFELRLIQEHLAGNITAEQLSSALHTRKQIESQRNIFTDVMVRASRIVNILNNATTQEELNTVMAEKNAIITALGGTFSVATQ